MANRTIELTLKSNVQGLVNGVKTAQKAATDAGRSLDDFRRQNEQAWNTAGQTLATAGAALTATTGMAVKAAIDWETAWAGVQKTNDGTEQQMTALEEDLRNLATTLPATHAEIAAVAEAAGQLGVGVDDVSEFTETMINLGETTNLSADEAATALARFSNITGTSFADVDKLGSALVGLGNNFATTESEILQMSERLAAAGSQAGLSEGEILGLATAMSSVGIEAEAGGTAMTMTFNEIDAAVREGGESLQGWADVAGTSASEFAEVWRNDPAEAITMVVEGLARVQSEGGSVAGTLEDLGVTGIRQADALRRLSGDAEQLGEAFAMGNEEFEKNAALSEEAAIRYETTASKIQVAWNNIQDAAIEAGEHLLPVVDSIVDGVSGVADAFGALPDPVQGAVAKLGGVAGVTAAAAGGFMLLAPRAIDTYQAFKDLRSAAKGLPGPLRNVGRAAGIAAAGFVAISAMDAVWEQFAGAPPDIRDTTLALEGLAKTGEYTGGIENFGAALEDLDTVGGRVKSSMPGWAAVLATSVNPTFAISADAAKDLAAELENTDNAAAEMMRGGNFDAVGGLVQKIAEDFESAGRPLDQIKADFPELDLAMREAGTSMDEFLSATGALPPVMELVDGELVTTSGSLEELKNRLTSVDEAADGAAASSAEIEGALEDVGLAADGTVESLSDYIDKLFEAGIAEQSSMQAQASYQESLRGVQEAVEQLNDPESGLGGLSNVLNEAKDGFDLTTDAGRIAQDAFLDVASSGMDMASAMADAGASQDEIQSSLEGTYEDLIATAGEFNITGEAAEELARSVLGVPDGVDIETWMSESAKRTADETAASVFQLPDNVDIDTFMSDEAFRMSELTKAGIDSIPNSDEVETWMSDDAFIQALATRAAVLDIPEEDVINSFMSSAARDEADETTAAVLGIPEGVSVTSWMSSEGRDMAMSTDQWLDAIDGRHTRSRHTHTTVNEIVTLQKSSNNARSNVPGYAAGGRVPRRSTGGRLPYTGLGADQILGIGSQGNPTAWVDDGEWVIRERSARKYNSVLERINRDHPSVQHLAGYANGGRTAASAVEASRYAAGGAVDARQITEAIRAGAQSGAAGVNIESITAVGGDTQQVVNRVGDAIFRRLREEGVPVGAF